MHGILSVLERSLGEPNLRETRSPLLISLIGLSFFPLGDIDRYIHCQTDKRG
jgi:hypothetical protein